MSLVIVRAPTNPDAQQLEGKIDSGADLCALPESVIVALDLPPVRTVRAAGFAGLLQEAILYHADFEIAGQRFKHVEALGTRRPYVIIGRNVLARFVVRLDGPKKLLTVTPPSGRRRRTVS